MTSVYVNTIKTLKNAIEMQITRMLIMGLSLWIIYNIL